MDDDQRLSPLDELKKDDVIATMHLAEAVMALLGDDPLSDDQRKEHRHLVARSAKRLAESAGGTKAEYVGMSRKIMPRVFGEDGV